MMKLEVYTANNLNFVEFNTTGDTNTFERCDKNSLYMDTEAFNLFSGCFESSNNLYDYFGPTKYNSRNIVILLNELKAMSNHIKGIEDPEGFMEFAGNKFLGAGFILELEKQDKNWMENWMEYKSILMHINQQLIDLANTCMEKDKLLWVIGY